MVIHRRIKGYSRRWIQNRRSGFLTAKCGVERLAPNRHIVGRKRWEKTKPKNRCQKCVRVLTAEAMMK